MKKQLAASAAALPPPSQAAADEFSRVSRQLAEMGSRIIGERPDFEKLVGPDNRQTAEDNNRNFGRFSASLFKNFNPEVLVETVLWVFRAYRSHGFHSTYWAVNLSIWSDLIDQELSEETAAALAPYYDWLIVNIPIFVQVADEQGSAAGDEQIPAH